MYQQPGTVAGVPGAVGLSCITGGRLGSHRAVWLTENFCWTFVDRAITRSAEEVVHSGSVNDTIVSASVLKMDRTSKAFRSVEGALSWCHAVVVAFHTNLLLAHIFTHCRCCQS